MGSIGNFYKKDKVKMAKSFLKVEASESIGQHSNEFEVGGIHIDSSPLGKNS